MNTLASYYGLNKRLVLEEIADNHIAIVKRIKSRIIQKDALKIIEIAGTIRTLDASMKVSLLCNDNICSKTLALLKENAIEVIFS